MAKSKRAKVGQFVRTVFVCIITLKDLNDTSVVDPGFEKNKRAQELIDDRG